MYPTIGFKRQVFQNNTYCIPQATLIILSIVFNKYKCITCKNDKKYINIIFFSTHFLEILDLFIRYTKKGKKHYVNHNIDHLIKKNVSNLSLSIIVLSLCAIVITVHSANSERMVAWIKSSVSKSTAAVASSRIRIFVLRRRVLARHTSWRWPTLWRHQSSKTLID